jgi:hypothetical protein
VLKGRKALGLAKSEEAPLSKEPLRFLPDRVSYIYSSISFTTQLVVIAPNLIQLHVA